MLNFQALKGRVQQFDRDEYEKDEHTVFDAWIRQIEDLEVLSAIMQSPVMKDIIQNLQADIAQMDQTLLTKRRGTRDGQLSELEHNNILDRKELYTNFIKCFDVAEKYKSIETQIREAEERSEVYDRHNKSMDQSV